MEKQKKEEKKEFVDLMVKKAYSQDSKPEPYIPKIITKRDPELKPYKESVNVEQIEEVTEKIKANLIKKSQPK